MSTAREPRSASTKHDRPLPEQEHKSLWQDALNVPNLITVSRLLLAIVLFVLISVEGFWITSAILFLLAASTDAIDGYIARKYGLVTVLGRIMDPFVDKIIVGGAFIFLAALPASGVNAWMALIVIAREMFVTTLRGFLEQQGRDFSASFSGKLKMALQCVAVFVALVSLHDWFKHAWFPLSRQQYDWILLGRNVVLWAAVAATVFSGLIYVTRATRVLRSGRS